MKLIKYLLVVLVLCPIFLIAQDLDALNQAGNQYVWLNKKKYSLKIDSSNSQAPQSSDPIEAFEIFQKNKTYSKSFQLEKDEKINVENKYGSVTVKTWNRNEIKVDVDIKVYSNSEKDAEKLIDGVNIDAKNNEYSINFKTIIANNSGNFGSTIRNGVVRQKRELSVNYVIYTPATQPLNVSQVYGNIIMGDYNGPLAIKLQYGAFKANTLSHQNNYFNFQYAKCDIEEVNAAVVKHTYGSGLNILNMKQLELDAKYVNVKLGNIKNSAKINQEYGNSLNIEQIKGNLNLNARYANINIGTVEGNTNLKSDYGNVTVNSLSNISLSTRYANVKIGNLNGDGNFKMNYNSLSVNYINSTCKNLTFEGDYVQVNFGFSNHFGGDFIVENSYGNFRNEGNIISKLTSNTQNNKIYKGRIGSITQSLVSVKSSYGNINFK